MHGVSKIGFSSVNRCKCCQCLIVCLLIFFLQRLYALGGEVADSSQKVTHLVTSKVTRTVKFLTAMSVVKHIVKPEWLEESWRSQKFVGMRVFCGNQGKNI